MGIPSQTEMFKFVLEIMSDYHQFSRRDAAAIVCTELQLSDEEQDRKTSSGVPIYESRTGWAVTWLYDAGCLTRVGRGTYAITEKGTSILGENLTAGEFAKRLREEINRQTPEGGEQAVEQEALVSDTSPMERLDMIVKEMNSQLSHEIMDAIMSVEGRAGALGAVTRGAFITTSYFTQEAITFAQNYPHADIILINREKLTELMIRYNLGVSVERDIYIKRIDSDYFEQ